MKDLTFVNFSEYKSWKLSIVVLVGFTKIVELTRAELNILGYKVWQSIILIFELFLQIQIRNLTFPNYN